MLLITVQQGDWVLIPIAIFGFIGFVWAMKLTAETELHKGGYRKDKDGAWYKVEARGSVQRGEK
jgi:hypothetical protein